MRMFRFAPGFLLLLLALAVAAGCQREEPPPAPKAAPKSSLHVIVPPEIKAKWKAVRIVVHDKQAGRDLTYTVDVGGRFVLPESNLQVETRNFLPAFATDGKSATSVSNDPKNPGIEIVLREGDTEVGRGWLFRTPPSGDPDRHQLSHPRYSFSLAEVIARR